MSDDKQIRFVDSGYKTLFYLPDGANVVLHYEDGSKKTLSCMYIDEYHVQVGNGFYHICEFAERMERACIPYTPEIPQPLPERCFSTLPSTGQLIHITRGQGGYKECPFSSPYREKNENEAASLNARLRVTPQQEAAMLGGSMFGWSTPAARTSSYDLRGQPIKPAKSRAKQPDKATEPTL